MRRAVISIPSNIAEGYARKSTKEYLNFLSIAFGSGAELETQFLLAKELDLAAKEKFTHAENLLTEAMKMLNVLQHKLTPKF